MCICGGIGEAVVVVAIGGYAMKRAGFTMPPLRELVGKVRTGVRPGQVFKDKRKKARVNERACIKAEAHE